MKKIFLIAFFSILILLGLASKAFADGPKITSISGNQPAPFSGVLLNEEASAQIMVTLKNIDEQISIESSRKVAIAKAECQKTLADESAKHKFDMTVVDAQLKEKTKENEQLHKLLKDAGPSTFHDVLLVGSGVAAGVVVTLAAVFVVGAVR